METSTVDNLVKSMFAGLDLMSFTIIIMFLSFVVMFWRAQAKNQLNWIDLIRKPGSPTISLTKVIQLLGAMVATWIMVKMAMADKVSWDLLATYLAYVGSVEGYSKFVSAKYGNSQPKDDKKDNESS